MLALLALFGCTASVPYEGPLDPQLTPPQITSVALGCDVEDESWRMDVEASSWTSGGDLYWSVDGDYVEKHYVRSRSAAADGTSDALRVDLSIVGDWRDASSGSSTAFHCYDDPAWVLVVYDTEGAVTDCRYSGDVWADDADVPACELEHTE